MCFNQAQKHLCPGESTSPDLVTNQRPRKLVEDYYYEENEDEDVNNCDNIGQEDSSEDIEIDAALITPSNQKKYRAEDNSITSAATPKHHSSEYRMLHACNCGKTRTIREDPFDVKVCFVL